MPVLIGALLGLSFGLLMLTGIKVPGVVILEKLGLVLACAGLGALAGWIYGFFSHPPTNYPWESLIAFLGGSLLWIFGNHIQKWFSVRLTK